MNSIYEVNMMDERANNNGRIQATSPIVEVFSSLVNGTNSRYDGKLKDKAIKELSEMAGRALSGDPVARGEINAVIRFAIEPRLLSEIKLYDFMGSYKQIGFDQQPMIRTYNYESVDARIQASSGDVPFATINWREYPISTVTISSGISVDYRELQNGNFDGSLAEGMSQVIIDMRNKSAYYVLTVLRDAVKNATGVKHYAEEKGVTKTMIDDMLKKMRRYGRVNIAGDYSAVSQLNEFSGYRTFSAEDLKNVAIPFGSAAVADEIRRTGLVNFYNGAPVTELPNGINFTKLNAKGDDYELYLPEGLLFFIPQGTVSPLQMFTRGGLTTMEGSDIVTRQYMTRFDLEFGAGVAQGMEDQIGIIYDTNYDSAD